MALKLVRARLRELRFRRALIPFYDQKAIQGHLRADRRATTVVRATRRNRKGTPQQQRKTWWPGIGESCWESLPPTFCVDALGGHLARRWGALLRLLRLPCLGHQARLFVHLDPLLARNRRDQLANRFERQIVRRLEMNATLPHVELLPRRPERRLQLLELTRTPKRAHQVERVVVLLRRERDVADRLLVVSVWISRQGDRPADRAPDEALIVAARNVFVHECAHRRDRLRTIGGE